jgi:hypothetical protein
MSDEDEAPVSHVDSYSCALLALFSETILYAFNQRNRMHLELRWVGLIRGIKSLRSIFQVYVFP